jgi:peptide subunit release factor 1 (eRF1)
MPRRNDVLLALKMVSMFFLRVCEYREVRVTHKCRKTGKNLSKSKKVERELRARPIHGKMKTGRAI